MEIANNDTLARTVFLDFASNLERPLRKAVAADAPAKPTSSSDPQPVGKRATEGVDALRKHLNAVREMARRPAGPVREPLRLALVIDGLDAACRYAALGEPFGPRSSVLFREVIDELREGVMKWIRGCGFPIAFAVFLTLDDSTFGISPFLQDLKVPNLGVHQMTPQIEKRRLGEPVPFQSLIVSEPGNGKMSRPIEILARRAETVCSTLGASRNIMFTVVGEVKAALKSLARFVIAEKHDRSRARHDCMKVLSQEQNYYWYALIVDELRYQLAESKTRRGRRKEAVLPVQGLVELVEAVLDGQYAPQLRQTGAVSNILSLASSSGALAKVLKVRHKSAVTLTGLNLRGADFRLVEHEMELRYCDLTDVKWPGGREEIPTKMRATGFEGNFREVNEKQFEAVP
jgi:hypothetical protein